MKTLFRLCITSLFAALSLSLGNAQLLSDYGAIPKLTTPPSDKTAASQKLDYHTDLFTGRFGYTIPIKVPPARGGTEPNLSLQYNSADKNSWCGVGWDVDFGYIQRETRFGVPIQPGAFQYSDTNGFVYSFGGHSGRLISVGSGVYYPQINTDFLKFVYSNGWWIATDKGGRKYYFGEASGSRIFNSFGTFKWGLSSLHDPNGNQTTVSYSADTGQLYLSEIDYNANNNSPSISANCSIIFDLEATRRTDTNSTDIAGSEIQTRYRLQNIRVLCQGVLVRRYGLSYGYSTSTGRSLLGTVTEYGSDNVSSLPPRNFYYSKQANGFSNAVAWPVIPEAAENLTYPYTNMPANEDIQIVDINGDGLPDWVTVANGPYFTSFNVQLNTNGGFGPQTTWSPLSDETGDTTIGWGRVDYSYSTPDWSQSISSLVDLNGDGLPDRVLRQHDVTIYDHLQVQLNSGTNFNARASWTGLTSSDPGFDGSVMNVAYAQSHDGEGNLATLIDMNGDGRPDRVMEGSVNNRFDVQLNLNGSFSSIVAWGNVSAAGPPTYYYTPRCRDFFHVYSELMDMNGDGLPDRVLQSGVQLNNGHGFDSYQTTWGYNGSDPETVNPGYYTVQLLDMNGDGLPDRVVSNGDGTYTVYFNTGRGFSSTGTTWTNVSTYGQRTIGLSDLQAWDPGNGTLVMFADMNGDGLPDRIVRNYWLTNALLVQLNKGPLPDLMVEASNSIGGSVLVNYAPSTKFDNSDGSRPRLPFPMYVVTSVIVDDGFGDKGTNTYSYKGGLWDTTWREFRGFSYTVETDPLGMVTYTYFHQGAGLNSNKYGEYQDSIYKAGMPWNITVLDSNGNFYKETYNTVDQVRLDPSGVYFPYVTNSFTYESEPGLQNSRITLKQFQYNVTQDHISTSTGNLLEEYDWGEVTNVAVYDSNHNTIRPTFSLVPNVSLFKIYTYASLSNPDIIDRPQSISLCADSAAQNVLRQSLYQYFGSTGDLQQKSDLICPGSFATNSYSYDAYGNVLAATNPVGIVTTSAYDATATFATLEYTGTLTNKALYDLRSGSILLATNAQGLVTSNAYDVFLRLTNSAVSTSQNGAPNLTRKMYQYGLGGLSGATSYNYVREMDNDPANASTGFHENWTYYDGLGRVIQTRNQAETSGQYRVIDVVYDLRGSVIAEDYPVFQSGSSYSYPSGNRTNVYTLYDAINRPYKVYPCAWGVFSVGHLQSETALNGDSGSQVGPTTLAFNDGTNPWAMIVTNALGKAHKYLLDAFGRTNQIVEITAGASYNTYVGWDPVGNLTNITDSASNQMSFFYDSTGRRVALADPNIGFWQYAFDRAGRPTVQTDAKGQQIKFFYNDAAGRLTRREGWSNATQIVSIVSYQYDSNGGDNSYTVYPGQLFLITDDEGSEKFSNDVRGRTLKSVRYLSKNGTTYTNLWTFDDADRASSITYPNGGPTVTNIYDTGFNLSKVQRVGSGGTVYYTAQGFDELDRLTGINFGNGTASTFSYYPISKRLNQIATTIPGGSTIQSCTNTYDKLGNITGIQDLVSGHTGGVSATISSASYDDLNRAISVNWPGYGQMSYSYDSTGNVITNGEFGTGKYNYGTGGIRPACVRSANGAWFAYDPNGNMVFRTKQRLDYDVNNHLWRVIATNAVTTYFGYNGSGARLWEQTGTNTIQVWIGNNYEEKNGLVLYHIYAGGKLICTFDKTGTNVFQYYHSDYITSTSIQTDTNGNQIQHYEYTAFGQTRYTQSTAAFPVSRRYTSQVLDDATGLYYYNFRYYDPQLGRFIQPDDVIPEIGNPQSYNRYSYVENNPLRFTDPTGHGPGSFDEGHVAYRVTLHRGGSLRQAVAEMNSINQASSSAFIASSVGFTVAAVTDGAATPVLVRAGASKTFAAVGSGMIASAAGDLASQVTQIGLGQRKSISGQEVAISTLIGGALNGTASKLASLETTPMAAEGTAPKLMYHYTTAEESSFANGLWRDSSVTDKLYTDAAQASRELGIPVPNKVIPIQDVGQFVPNKPPIVQPSFRFPGGGTDFVNPQPVPPSQLLPAQPIGPK